MLSTYYTEIESVSLFDMIVTDYHPAPIGMSHACGVDIPQRHCVIQGDVRQITDSRGPEST